MGRPGDPWTAQEAAPARVWDGEGQPVPGFRVGGRVLTVLSTPLNLRVLTALVERPMRLAELRRYAGLPAQTTLRGHLASLTQIGVISKRQTAQMPYAVENELTPMGLALLEAAEVLASWLAEAPDGPVPLESSAASGTVKAFADGWSSTIVRGLAARPMSLTELDGRIPGLSYPALERRLSSMRMAGLIEARESEGPGTPYAITTWARKAIAPLGAAVDCERTHMGERAAPLTELDVEAAFFLAMPLVGLPVNASGRCQLEVDGDARAVRSASGVNVTVEHGRIVVCDAELEPSPEEFAGGSVTRWCRALSAGEPRGLRLGGPPELPSGLIAGLHDALLAY